jgi:hypothetical protein
MLAAILLFSAYALAYTLVISLIDSPKVDKLS